MQAVINEFLFRSTQFPDAAARGGGEGKGPAAFALDEVDEWVLRSLQSHQSSHHGSHGSSHLGSHHDQSSGASSELLG